MLTINITRLDKAGILKYTAPFNNWVHSVGSVSTPKPPLVATPASHTERNGVLMKATFLDTSEATLLETRVHGDDYGFIFENFNHAQLDTTGGIPASFIQGNHSRFPIKQPKAQFAGTYAQSVSFEAIEVFA